MEETPANPLFSEGEDKVPTGNMRAKRLGDNNLSPSDTSRPQDGYQVLYQVDEVPPWPVLLVYGIQVILRISTYYFSFKGYQKCNMCIFIMKLLGRRITCPIMYLITPNESCSSYLSIQLIEYFWNL